MFLRVMSQMPTQKKGKRRKKKESPSKPPVSSEVTDPETPMAFSRQLFLEKFPHLSNELEAYPSRLNINGVRWEETERTKTSGTTEGPKFAGYSPDIIDFLRRCTTEEEAFEIIDFLEEKRELDPKHAEILRQQLRSRGIRSFGSKKHWGYYEREAQD